MDAGSILTVRGCEDAANNGRYRVTSVRVIGDRELRELRAQQIRHLLAVRRQHDRCVVLGRWSASRS